ncbi:MAG: glycogen/starch synthase, partial [bacterium]|nr:glycogen/starch synthase [bacterium]
MLAVASEIYPLIKTGGLADVVGALPAALAAHGVMVRTLVPGYPAVLARVGKGKVVARYDSLFGVSATVVAASVDGLDLLILDAPDFFAREGGPYGDHAGNAWGDNWRRFAALSRVGADIAAEGVKGWRPDAVHAHDWQAAMTAAYMRFGPAHAVPKIVTIHNLAFQGRFGADVFGWLGLPPEAWGMDGVEYYGGIGYLKAGLVSADAITTVSPTYAEEIGSPVHGMGLDGLINGRGDRLHGILNGVDTAIWNPAADSLIARPFSGRALAGRAANRRALRSWRARRNEAAWPRPRASATASAKLPNSTVSSRIAVTARPKPSGALPLRVTTRLTTVPAITTAITGLCSRCRGDSLI